MKPPRELVAFQQKWIQTVTSSHFHILLAERCVIYNHLAKNWGEALVQWLGYQTALHVQPRFITVLPDDVFVPRSLKLTHRLLEGRISVDSLRVEKLLEQTYHATGNFWGYEEDEIDNSTYYAGCASRAALLVACGYRATNETYKDYFDIYEEAYHASRDPASGAVLSIACLQYKEFDLIAARDFWLWWLDEGLTQSWQSMTMKTRSI